MNSLTIYTKPNCPYCSMAKGLLNRKNIPFLEVDISKDQDARQFVISEGHKTVPQIYFGKNLFVEGGYTGLSNAPAEKFQELTNAV